MARPISDEELQLKKRARRRLVGAIVLVTAVAVVLPMVLDSEPKPVSHNVDIRIPALDAGEFKPKGGAPAPGSKSAKAWSDAVAKSEKAESGTAHVAPPPAARAAPPAVPKEPSKAESPKSAPPEPKAAGVESAKETVKSTAAGAYVVQVAALSDAAKAKHLQKQLAGIGLKGYTEIVKTQNGEVTRVRAGPYATREVAEKARVQLKKAGLDGKVVPK